MINRRHLIQKSAAFALAPAFGSHTVSAQAPTSQAWPTRFVKLVVPFTPGGGIDGIGRILAARLSEMWGQQVVVENKPGAGGNIASEFVARAAPDGYTMYITAAGLAVNRYLFGSVNYDPVADFAPVTLICLFPNLLVVPNSSPFRSVGDLLAQAQKNPGKVTFASPGHGSSPHMSGELFKYMAQVDLTHVPYRGAAPAFTDVIAGRVDCMFAVMASGLPLARSGQLRALGVTTANALADGAGGADHRGGRRARLRHVVLVRFLRAGQDAARDHSQDARRHRRRARRAGDQGEARSSSAWWWSARRPRRSARISRLRWRSGGRSSRRPNIKVNE